MQTLHLALLDVPCCLVGEIVKDTRRQQDLLLQGLNLEVARRHIFIRSSIRAWGNVKVPNQNATPRTKLHHNLATHAGYTMRHGPVNRVSSRIKCE